MKMEVYKSVMLVGCSVNGESYVDPDNTLWPQHKTGYCGKEFFLCKPDT